MKINQSTIGRGVQRINQPSIQSQSNRLFNGVYTPVVSASAGALTTVSGSVGTFDIIPIDVPNPAVGSLNFLVFIDVTFQIVTNGTGSGHVYFTVPQDANGLNYNSTGQGMISGAFYPAATGFLNSLTVQAAGAVVVVYKYDSTYPGADGNTFVISGWYAAQTGP